MEGAGATLLCPLGAGPPIRKAKQGVFVAGFLLSPLQVGAGAGQKEEAA